MTHSTELNLALCRIPSNFQLKLHLCSKDKFPCKSPTAREFHSSTRVHQTDAHFYIISTAI